MGLWSFGLLVMICLFLIGCRHRQHEIGAVVDAAEPLDVTALPGDAIGRRIQVYVDERGEKTVEEISTGKGVAFRQLLVDRPGFGFSQAAYWFRIRTRNPSNNRVHWKL
jgi:hypothetical protein